VPFRPEAFEPLTETPWDERRVEQGIREIVADAEAAFEPDGLWPADEWDGWRARLPLKGLYVGAAGVVHALDVLRRRDLAEPRVDLEAAALRALELYRREPDFIDGYPPPHPAGAGLFVGETGILVVARRLTGDDALAEDLLERVRENSDGARPTTSCTARPARCSRPSCCTSGRATPLAVRVARRRRRAAGAPRCRRAVDAAPVRHVEPRSRRAARPGRERHGAAPRRLRRAGASGGAPAGRSRGIRELRGGARRPRQLAGCG